MLSATPAGNGRAALSSAGWAASHQTRRPVLACRIASAWLGSPKWAVETDCAVSPATVRCVAAPAVVTARSLIRSVELGPGARPRAISGELAIWMKLICFVAGLAG